MKGKSKKEFGRKINQNRSGCRKLFWSDVGKVKCRKMENWVELRG